MSSALEPQITDLVSTLLYHNGNTSIRLRVVEYKDKEGKISRKFGLSEYLFSAGAQSWYPASKRHVFLPMSVWPSLVGHTSLIADLVNLADGATATLECATDPELLPAVVRCRGRVAKRSERDATIVASVDTASNGDAVPSPEMCTQTKKIRTEEDSNVGAELGVGSTCVSDCVV
jgi:hypothetical protein